ncbi:hypothetical protein BGX38DRAFT_1189756 [Terfezia claveryi]|nr:hypothetical protein BGX38DRAFT_1189756 [Terfezia claveryi]
MQNVELEMGEGYNPTDAPDSAVSSRGETFGHRLATKLYDSSTHMISIEKKPLMLTPPSRF